MYMDKCRTCNVVCLYRLQTMGFVLNVGQQILSYVKGRQAGRCKESCWCCAALAMEEAALHIRLPEHCWQWAETDTDRKRRRDPVMKTVLSLHRKWAHAVKTIRILQGLVSLIVQFWLQFDQVCELTQVWAEISYLSGTLYPRTWRTVFG